MSLKKLIAATTMATAFGLAIMPSSVWAATQTQELKTEANAKVTCTGSYGQSCTAEASSSAQGKQTQSTDCEEVVYRADGKAVCKHKKLANAGLDMTMATGVTSILMTGSVAAYLKLKNRVA